MNEDARNSASGGHPHNKWLQLSLDVRRLVDMKTQAHRGVRRPKVSVGISGVLGSLAVIQLCGLTVLLLFGDSVPLGQAIHRQLSPIDWCALYGLQFLLAYSMWRLFLGRRNALTWFISYTGVGAWCALLYSFSPYENPHFDVFASLMGLFVTLAVLAYMVRLRWQEILR